MCWIVDGELHGLADEASFIETLNRLDHNSKPELRSLFETERELIVARAPGRLDVMGGIADYSGSMVLQLPIEEATYVALQHDPSRTLRIVTLQEDIERQSVFEMPLAEFEDERSPIDYETAMVRFQSEPSRRWAAYVAGVFLVFMREHEIRFDEGARILINSRVPEGKGVSSSAALEVAVMQAVAGAYGINVSPRQMAVLCQMVENLVAGAPCGIMDQMTASCGESNRLLALLCQPAELMGTISIPDEIAFWGLDSGLRHAVTGADYSSVRVGAFMGRRIISDLLKTDDIGSWTNCLANLTPSTFEQHFAAHLPVEIRGKDFLARYHHSADMVTRIDPDRSYPVRSPATHPVYENHRVRLFAHTIGSSRGGETRLELLGELMYQSHASYSGCGLGSTGTDLLVELVRQAGPEQGLFGARITGGGSGGTVVVVGRSSAGAAVAEVAQEYANQTGYSPYVFSGSSPGSAGFGHLRLRYSPA